MQKIFSELRIKADGKVLPKDKFRLFCEIDTPTFDEDKKRALIKRAEKYIDIQIPVLTASSFMQMYKDGNISNYGSPFGNRRSIALDCALAEYFERKGRFTKTLVDVVWAILEESSWVPPEHIPSCLVRGKQKLPPVQSGSDMHGIDLVASTTAGVLAAVHYYCKDILDEVSPVICERIVKEIYTRVITPYLHYPFHWTGIAGNKVNNWVTWISQNILFATALLEEDTYVRERVVQSVMDCLDRFTSFYPQDGGCEEGPVYWNAAAGCYFDCLELIYDMTGGKIDVYSHPFIKSMGEYEMHLNISSNYFVNFADASPRATPDGTHINRFGEKCGSKTLADFGNKFAQMLNMYVDRNLTYRSLRNLITKKPTEYAFKPQTKVWLPSLKVMVSREFDDETRGFFLAAKGGHNGESHNHNDVGNFIVYRNAKPIIIDAGVETYTRKTFSAERYTIWTMQSSYHNLPDINGCAQHQGERFASSNEYYDTESGALSAELAAAYVPEARVKSFVRQAKLTDGVITVTDTIALDGEGELTFHLMTRDEPALLSECEIALAENTVLTFDKALSARIEPIEITDQNMRNNWQTDRLYRIHLSARACEKSFVFVIK